MQNAIRATLIQLCEEFKRAGEMYPALYHQQLLVDPEFLEMTPESWRAFAEANSPPVIGEWQSWHGPVQGPYFLWYGRFFGSGEGLVEYKQLTESLFFALRTIDERLPDQGGYEAMLERLHEIADKWPSPLLRSKETVWNVLETNVGGQNPIDELHARIVKDKIGTEYPLHPFVETIDLNLFSATSDAIRRILDDETTLFIADGHFFDPDYPSLDDDDEIDAASIVISCRPEEAKPSEVAPPTSDLNDFEVSFDPQIGKWHVRFRFGIGPDNVEDAWVPDQKAMKYITHLLKNPQTPIDSAAVFPSQPKPDGNSKSSKPYQEEGRLDEEPKRKQSVFKQGLKTKDDHRQQIAKLNEDIAEARKNAELGDKDAEAMAATLESDKKALMSWFNKNFDKFGRERESVDSTAQNATNKIRNSIDSFKVQCVNTTSKRKYKLHHFAMYLEETIVCGGAYCEYRQKDKKPWVIKLSDEE